MGILRWYGPVANKMVMAQVGGRIKAATDVLYATAQEKVSVMSGSPSQPGEYPHMETGEFKATIKKEFDPNLMEGRVGSNDPVAFFLEVGTRKMKKRPWLTLLVRQMQPKLRGVVLKKHVPAFVKVTE